MPDTAFAEECVKSLEDMKRDALNIISELKNNLEQFEYDILEFYTEGKIIMEGYIEKIKSLAGKSCAEILKSCSSFINQ